MLLSLICRVPVRGVVFGLFMGMPVALDGQANEAQSNAPSAYDHTTAAPVAQAVRTHAPIVLDGRLDEEVWQAAPPVTDLWQNLPDEGALASQRTEVRFLYDDENLYVGARLWESGEIVHRLARRDAFLPDSDLITVALDSYHDHRTAYRFSVGPTGSRRDVILTDQGQDASWDPIWEHATSIVDDGWIVEMRIPFSQLRFSQSQEQVWGLQIQRRILPDLEVADWAFTPQRERGGVARFGHLVGIEGISSGSRLELLPYTGGRLEVRDVARADAVDFDNPFRSGADAFLNGGLDVKFRITSNLTLDATVNPDFGQVEMDPSVINLTAFETRFDERRPFFVEGAEIFRFGETGGGGGPGGAGGGGGGGGGGGAGAGAANVGDPSQLLYSRRIGREPQGDVPDLAAYTDVPTATTILGALKLTGKTPDGWSVGILNAVTGRESAAYVTPSAVIERMTVEPRANYFVGRVRRDMRDGAAAIGVMGTMVHRDLEPGSHLDARLRASAYAFGLDGRLAWDNQAWMLTGSISPSRVAGSSDAIARTQRFSARYMQRPDADHLSYDPRATSLTGVTGQLGLFKQAGDWQGHLATSFVSPGYEVNDLGFQLAADRAEVAGEFGYYQTDPGAYLRRWSLRTVTSLGWNLGGESQTRELGLTGNGQSLNLNSFSWRVTRRFATWDDRLTRGGPLARSPAETAAVLGFSTDIGRPRQVRGNVSGASDEAGGWQYRVAMTGTIRAGGAYEFQLGPTFRRAHVPAQYVRTVTDATADHTYGARYVFAGLDQTTFGVQARINASFSPFLSLEIYAEPFVSSGAYHDLMELARPGTFDFLTYGEDLGTVTRDAQGRYTVDPRADGSFTFDVNDPSFNFRSLLGNAVLRWDWRPGSTLFLVWQQSRLQRLTALSGAPELAYPGSFELDRDLRAVFGLKPENVFLIKVNYWLNP